MILLSSHILMILVVAGLSVYFYMANRSQRRRSGVLENTVWLLWISLFQSLLLANVNMFQEGFRFTY